MGAYEEHENRLRVADLIIDCCPVAKKYVPKDFMEKEEIAKLPLVATQEEMEKNIFDLCNNAYWNVNEEDEAGDTNKYFFIDGGYINDEDELEDWANELGLEDY